MQIENFKPYESGALIGFGDLETDDGMKFRKCSFFKKGSHFFMSFYSEKKENDNGATEYFPIITFWDDDARKKFQNQVSPIIAEAYAKATDKQIEAEIDLPF